MLLKIFYGKYLITRIMLEHLDQQLFLFLNSINSPFWDQVMWIISATFTWVPLYLAILIALGIAYKRKILVLLLIIIIAITISDQLSVFIKNSVHRMRPCHEPAIEGLVHIVKNGCGGLYGFVSSHASNAFTAAVLSLMLIRRKWFAFSMIFWALLVSYSRIYLGVHYPGDVICGSIIGVFTGWGVVELYRFVDRKLLTGSKFFSSVITG
jgi:undecaprenyl-diphosphatase